MTQPTSNPELLADIVLRELERIYCECVEQEPPINPARTCSACGMAIDFESIPDFLEWSDSLKVQR